MTRFICECSHEDDEHPDPWPNGLPSNGPVYPCTHPDCKCGDMRIVRTSDD